MTLLRIQLLSFIPTYTHIPDHVVSICSGAAGAITAQGAVHKCGEVRGKIWDLKVTFDAEPTSGRLTGSRRQRW